MRKRRLILALPSAAVDWTGLAGGDFASWPAMRSCGLMMTSLQKGATGISRKERAPLSRRSKTALKATRHLLASCSTAWIGNGALGIGGLQVRRDGSQSKEKK